MVLAGASKALASVQVLLLGLAVVQYNLGAPLFFSQARRSRSFIGERMVERGRLPVLRLGCQL